MTHGQLNRIANLNIGLNARGTVGDLDAHARQSCGRRVGRFLGKRALPAAKVSLCQGLRLSQIDIAYNGKGGYVGLPVGLVGLFAVAQGDFGHARFGRQLAARVLRSEYSSIEDVALNGPGVVFLALQTRKRALFDLVKASLGQGRTLGNFGREGKEVLSVLAQSARIDAAAAGSEACANKVHFFVERLLGVGLGAFGEQVAKQTQRSSLIAFAHFAKVKI